MDTSVQPQLVVKASTEESRRRGHDEQRVLRCLRVVYTVNVIGAFKMFIWNFS